MPNSTTTRVQSTPQLACPRCAAIDQPVLGPGSGQHYAAALCRHCGRFLKWLSRHTPAERAARRQQGRLQALEARPPSQAQLDYLQVLGDADPPPATMAAASERIETLKKGVA